MHYKLTNSKLDQCETLPVAYFKYFEALRNVRWRKWFRARAGIRFQHMDIWEQNENLWGLTEVNEAWKASVFPAISAHNNSALSVDLHEEAA